MRIRVPAEDAEDEAPQKFVEVVTACDGGDHAAHAVERDAGLAPVFVGRRDPEDLREILLMDPGAAGGGPVEALDHQRLLLGEDELWREIHDLVQRSEANGSDVETSARRPGHHDMLVLRDPRK